MKKKKLVEGITMGTGEKILVDLSGFVSVTKGKRWQRKKNLKSKPKKK